MTRAEIRNEGKRKQMEDSRSNFKISNVLIKCNMVPTKI
jgi:hypothetical protein